MTVCNPPAKPLPYRNPISRTQILSYYLVSQDGSAELLSVVHVRLLKQSRPLLLYQNSISA